MESYNIFCINLTEFGLYIKKRNELDAASKKYVLVSITEINNQNQKELDHE